jgi:hypothetical protein
MKSLRDMQLSEPISVMPIMMRLMDCRLVIRILIFIILLPAPHLSLMTLLSV